LHYQSVTVNTQVRLTRLLDDPQTEATTPNIVRLSCDHLSTRLALGRPQPLTVPLDPRQALNYGEPDLIVAELSWCRYPHPAQRWVDANVEVLDVLVDDVYLDAANGQA